VCVLRIYLDQNKWVDLALAATGKPRGERFTDALAICRAGVASGTVSFPLDMYRYWETGKRRNDRSRNDVADVMRELSGQHTMAVPFGVLDQELDLALQRRFDRTEHPRQQQVFGVGMRHISEGRMTGRARPQRAARPAAHRSCPAAALSWRTRSSNSLKRKSCAPARTPSGPSASTTQTQTTANGSSSSRTSSRRPSPSTA